MSRSNRRPAARSAVVAVTSVQPTSEKRTPLPLPQLQLQPQPLQLPQLPQPLHTLLTLHRPRRQSMPPHGFTLIELLVALLILGIMSALGFGTYRAARISAERTEESLERSREIEFGMRVLVMDFSEMMPRPVRDPLGQSRLPALRGGPGNGTSASSTGTGEGLGADFIQHFDSGPGFQSTFGGTSSQTALPLAELTRGGWSNTAGQQRGTLQRVSYALVGEVLKRSYTTALDTLQGAKPTVQDLFTQVKTVQLRYLDANLAWQNTWPPAGMPTQQIFSIRPVAVEVTIEFKDWGRVRRLIEVAG